MVNKYEFVVTVDGKETRIDMPFYNLGNIAMELPDVKENKEIFNALSHHTSKQVLSNIAVKSNLSGESFERLFNTNYYTVMQSLLSNSLFKKIVEIEELQNIIKLDAEFANIIAQNIDEFENIDKKELTELLLTNKDPRVIHTTINNSNYINTDMIKKFKDYPDNLIALDTIKKLKT
jgi:hypothetical protein